ncbi:LysR family transcriptional regulator [Actinoplanes sp. TRM 88003]|uniref:LysR family transcriptional regulator n=1 Tax=Paractinoplanes aksuensis TaxID=2939490 RepID=A0ABT1E3L8_9ACTN|nr:LysR family transcriptional regulator [Actinoplanes aksuensis]MCO8277724.1 LysR family transcriptional regulator [Actinoplanes aksuensis]
MELRQLRHFIALAEERSFTRAASRELIVQSGLSSSIRGLEREVGAPLVRRGTRPLVLTAEGSALLPAARRVVRAAEDALQAVHNVSLVVSGTLAVGMAQTSGTGCPFLDWLGAFGQEHPGLDITVEQLPDGPMLDRLAASTLDCALTSAPVRPEQFDAYPLAETSLVLAVPPGHHLAGAAGARLPELAGERFVEMRPGSGPRAQTDRIFAEHHLERRVVGTANEWSVLLDLIAAGLGIGFVPEGIAAGDGVRLLALTGTAVRQQWSLVLPAPDAQSPAARRLAQYLIARQIPYEQSATAP